MHKDHDIVCLQEPRLSPTHDYLTSVFTDKHTHIHNNALASGTAGTATIIKATTARLYNINNITLPLELQGRIQATRLDPKPTTTGPSILIINCYLTVGSNTKTKPSKPRNCNTYSTLDYHRTASPL